MNRLNETKSPAGPPQPLRNPKWFRAPTSVDLATAALGRVQFIALATASDQAIEQLINNSQLVADMARTALKARQRGDV